MNALALSRGLLLELLLEFIPSSSLILFSRLLPVAGGGGEAVPDEEIGLIIF
jgi:hypothetical protein